MKVMKIAAIVVTAAVVVATAGAALAGAASLGAAFSGAMFGIGTTLGVSSGVMAGVLAATAMLDLSMMGSLINSPPPTSGGSQTKWKADPYAGIPYAMGRTLVAGNMVARVLKGDTNQYQGVCTVLSLGPITAYEASFMNKTTMVWGRDPLNPDVAAPSVGAWAGYTWEHRTIGACPETYAPGHAEGYAQWGAANRLSGLAAVFNTFVINNKASDTITDMMAPSWIIQGVKVYDPRLDSTYPGGSGPCRALDESTYVFSEDPHLHALTWALGRWQNGVKVAGIGAPISAINVAAFVEGANLNEARGWKIGGVIYTRPDTPWQSLSAMLQAGGSTPTLMGGIIGCVNRMPRVSLATITHADIVGKCSLAGTQPRRTRINGIIPQYRSEAHDWELVSAAEVSIADYVAIDGQERTKEVSYPLVQNVDQATQLATYDICDARELGPGTIPLKPIWLNYKLGDCVTFEPESGWPIKVIITGRALDATTGAVTYTVRSETDAKHDFALGKTGDAPPTASFAYTVPATDPAGEWTLNGTTLADNGAGIPALVITGAVSTTNADAVQFDYRPYTAGAADDDGWIASATVSPSVTHHEITSVTPETVYQVSVRYRIAGVWRARGILGPVAAGKLYPAGYLRGLIAASYTDPADNLVTAHDMGASVTLTVVDHNRVYSDRSVYVSGVAPITGLAFGSTYSLFYDDADRSGGAVVVQATADASAAGNSDNHPDRHYLGTITTAAAGAGDVVGGGVAPTYIVSRRIETLAADVALNANTLLAYQYNSQQLRDYVDGKLFVEGVAVNTVIVQEQSERIAGDEVLAQTIALIGSKSGDSSAFILNFNSVKASTTGETLAATINTINAANAATSASITDLQSIVLTPSGEATAKAVFQLNAAGHVVGYEATNDGSVGSLIFSFDSFTLVNPMTGLSMFKAEGGLVKMAAVEVDTLKVNTAMVPKIVKSTTSFTGGSTSTSTPILSTSLVLPIAGYVTVNGMFAQGFSNGPASWYFALKINGTKVAEVSATYPGDGVPVFGALWCEAGTITIELFWTAAPTVSNLSRNFLIQAFPNTQ